MTSDVSGPCLSLGLTVPDGPPHTETWLVLEGGLVPYVCGEFTEVSTWSPECWPQGEGPIPPSPSLHPAPQLSELSSQPTPQPNPPTELLTVSHPGDVVLYPISLAAPASVFWLEPVPQSWYPVRCWRGGWSLSLTLHFAQWAGSTGAALSTATHQVALDVTSHLNNGTWYLHVLTGGQNKSGL